MSMSVWLSHCLEYVYISLLLPFSKFDPDRRIVTLADAHSWDIPSVVELLVGEAHIETLGHYDQNRFAHQLSEGLAEADSPPTVEREEQVGIAFLTGRGAQEWLVRIVLFRQELISSLPLVTI